MAFGIRAQREKHATEGHASILEAHPTINAFLPFCKEHTSDTYLLYFQSNSAASFNWVIP